MHKVFNGFLIILLLISVVFLIQKYVAAKDTLGVSREAFAELNDLRAKYDTPALQWDNELEKLAIAHSQYMSDTGKFEHSSLSYSENILEGSGSLPGVSSFDNGHQVIHPWEMSSAHNRLMLDSRYTRGAIGIVGNYATFLAD